MTHLLLWLSLFIGVPYVQADIAYIPVGAAKIKKMVIAFQKIRNKKGLDVALAQTLTETVTHDLNFMDTFRLLDPKSFVEDSEKAGMTLGSFQLADWKGIGTEFLIKSSLETTPEKNLIFETHLIDVMGSKEVFSNRYMAPIKDVRLVAHNFANAIVQSLTGLPGIFLTKIAMSCDRTGKKEIYIMNFDGSEMKQVTQHRSISFAPAWSPDGSRLAYSLFTRHKNNIKNIDLYEYNFLTSSIRVLSHRKGINSGAAYSPDGKKIALTLSYLGNPGIFLLDPETQTVIQLTRSLGFDVDPSWSADGKRLAFVSSRTGMPMIFSMASDGSDIQRLTYAGRYNATPTWSPQKKKVGFAGWIDRSFDIFIMNPDGTKIERLTKNQGNNEDPYFSPDGNFLVFSSNRTGQKNIYVMNIDGTFVKRLTYGMGNCVSPKWSSPPSQPEEGTK